MPMSTRHELLQTQHALLSSSPDGCGTVFECTNFRSGRQLVKEGVPPKSNKSNAKPHTDKQTTTPNDSGLIPVCFDDALPRPRSTQTRPARSKTLGCTERYVTASNETAQSRCETRAFATPFTARRVSVRDPPVPRYMFSTRAICQHCDTDTDVERGSLRTVHTSRRTRTSA